MNWAHLTAATLLAGLLTQGCATSRKDQLEQVAKDWCQTIRASQVIPVYPLTEDVQPGDVFLVDLDVSKQHEQYEDKGFLPLDNHLARLDQVDYAAFYASSFDPGTPLPKAWLDQTPPFGSKAPRASFPSYTFTTTRGAGLNLAVPVSGVPVGLSLLGAQSATGSVTISDARTYGLGIFDLASRTGEWANNNRSLLVPYASTQGKPRYLRVVSRVFLTGGVDITLQDSRSVGGDLSVGAPRPVELLTTKTDSDAPRATVQNYKANVDELNKMVAASQSAGGAGGRVQVASASSRSITLKETFPRPLVIGYLGFDMKILEGGMLGPPAPSLAVIADSRQPETTSFFSKTDQLYLAATGKTTLTVEQLKQVLGRLGIKAPTPLNHNTFKRELLKWRRTQPDSESAKRRVIQAIESLR